MNIQKQIPLFVLTGFLGAGKTSLLNQIMHQEPDVQTGIIMNEFGELGIDGLLIQQQGLDLVEINNGSIFCSCRFDQFADALIHFSTLPIQRLIIETSGLSDPANIERILYELHPKLTRPIGLQKTISIIDSKSFQTHLQAMPAITRQIQYSHVLLMNKIDLVSETMRQEIAAALRELNPFAPIIQSTYTQIDPSKWMYQTSEFELPAPDASTNLPQNRPKTVLLVANQTYNKTDIQKFLAMIAPLSFRIKGFIATTEGWMYVDGVNQDISIRPSIIEREQSEIVIIANTQRPILSKLKSAWYRFFQDDFKIGR